MAYDELKMSPLGKNMASPEEVAIWLDIQKLNDAKSIKHLMDVIERNYHTKTDWHDIDFTSCRSISKTGNVFI